MKTRKTLNSIERQIEMNEEWLELLEASYDAAYTEDARTYCSKEMGFKLPTRERCREMIKETRARLYALKQELENAKRARENARYHRMRLGCTFYHLFYEY